MSSLLPTDQNSPDIPATNTFFRLDESKRNRIITAVFAEAAEVGMSEVGIKAVARRASIPVGSLYQYFGNRDRMAVCAVKLAARKLRTELDGYQGYIAELPFSEGIRVYLTAGISWSQEQRVFLRIFARAAYGGGLGIPAAKRKRDSVDILVDLVEPVARAMQNIVRTIVSAARERDELQDGLDDEAAVRLFNAMFISVGDAILLPGLDSYYRLYDDDYPPQLIIDRTVDLISRAICKSPPKYGGLKP